MALPIPERIGNYRIVRPLGRGGMATVYLAQDPAIDRLVAIKLVLASVDSPEIRERFAREARSAGRLRHPNIVTIFHVGEDASQPYIVMEYVPGETLADIIKQQLPLTLTRKMKIIEDLCRGLAHAHQLGVVHRDVKPANVLVDLDGNVKILDFGIARMGNQEMTSFGMMIGTPHYMAPEQITPGTTDHRSDVFAAGLVMYELLTYKRAFDGDTFSVLHSIVHDEPEPIEQLIPELDEELLPILHGALQKNPELRYQDINAMRGDLSRLRPRLHKGGDDEGPLPLNVQRESPAPARTTPAPATSKHLTLAKQAFDSGHYEQAVTECDRTLALDPANTTAIALRNRASLEMKARVEAAQETRLAEPSPASWEARGGETIISGGAASQATVLLPQHDSGSTPRRGTGAVPAPAPSTATRSQTSRAAVPAWALPAGAGAAVVILATVGWMLFNRAGDKEATKTDLVASGTSTIALTTSVPVTTPVEPVSTSLPPLTSAARPAQPALPTAQGRTGTAPLATTVSSTTTTTVGPTTTTIAPTTTTVAPTTSVAPATASVAVAAAAQGRGPVPDEKAAIQAVMDRYADAIRAKNMNAIKQVFPSSPAFPFASYNAIQITLSGMDINVEGNKATATFQRNMRMTPKAGKDQESNLKLVFQMERTASGWLITGQR